MADVVVVGGGLLGLSTAWALRDRREVVVLEQASIGHARGGSHGQTRIFRLGYAEAHYVAMAQEAAALWRDLEERCGERLLVPTPQLSFGQAAEDVFAALVAADVHVGRLTEPQVAAEFPSFAGHGDAVLETTSAVVLADRALAALRSECGADIREGTRVARVHADGVATDAGTIAARTVVVCAGPWARALIPELPTTPTLEHVAYVRTGPGLPIFIDFDEPSVYGLPTPHTDLFKIAHHHTGPVLDPDAEFAPEPRSVAALRDTSERWFPGAEIVEIDVCPYDNTADEAFIVERIDGVVVGAGTSGHAFKFGPLLGTQLAQLVLED